MVGDIRTFAYLRLYLFRIVHVFWTARGCVVEVSFHAPLRFENERMTQELRELAARHEEAEQGR
jgi:hypothetical protein